MKDALPESADSAAGRLPAVKAFASYVLCCTAFIVVVAGVRNFWELSRTYADNPAYLIIAQATLEGRFSGPDLQSVRNIYRGTGYGVALVSKLTTIPVDRCLPLLALACGALALYFCGGLWGWRVATLFSLINIAYTPRAWPMRNIRS
jgi:hypothetical protein